VKTFYEQLSLSRFASDEEIRAVIAQKRQELEPHDQADGFRRALLSRLEAAERILLNPERRARYDQDIDHQKAGSPGQAPKISASPIFSSASSTTPITPGQNVQRDRQQRLDDRPTEKSSCEICGASMAQDAISCSVCGAERTVSQSPTSQKSTGSGLSSALFAIPEKRSGRLEKLFHLLGWSCVRGTVVFADQPYQAEKEFILWRFLIKLALFGAVVYAIFHWAMIHLSVIILVFVIFVVLSLLTGGMLATMLGQIFSMSRFRQSNPKDQQVQIRDVRLRDEQLREYTVRFRGELRSGEAKVGDAVEIWGRNRGGTILARWGYNFRTSSRIWVKYR
jgi:hypothetical protein